MKNIHSNTIYLNIADFNIKVSFKKTKHFNDKKRMFDMIHSYYRGFIVHKKPKLINYSIIFSPDEHFYFLFKNKGMSYLLFYLQKNKKLITFYHIGIKQFDIMIRNIISKLLGGKGFILHGSAVNVNGSAYMFTGRPGAGKSTIMKLLSKKYLPLADDSVIIKKEKQDVFLYQTPFMEKEDFFKRGKGKYPLEKIFFLKKKPDLKIEKIYNKNYLLKRTIKQFWTEPQNLSSQSRLFLQFISSFDNFYFLSFPKKENLTEKFAKTV